MKAIHIHVRHVRELEAVEDLFLAADGKTIVRADDKRASFLLARKGQVISAKDAQRLGITESLDLDELQPKDQPAATSPEDIVARANRREKPAATR